MRIHKLQLLLHPVLFPNTTMAASKLEMGDRSGGSPLLRTCFSQVSVGTDYNERDSSSWVKPQVLLI